MLSEGAAPARAAAGSEVEAAELSAEQRYVDRVYRRLDALRLTAAESEKAGYGIAKVGNHGAYVERDAMVYHAARRRLALDAEYEGLVFGRLDMGPGARPPDGGPASAPVEPAVPGGEVRYIGRLGLRDERYEPLVVDWRAPAAAPFYRATAADAMDVVRRRTIRSQGERVVGVEDDLLDPDAAPEDLPVIGEGALLASLGRATGHGMRDIVATIQKEQDDAIRSPAAGVTIVRGGPGTGKTAVALHRAAYLLYNDRNRFESGGVLVVGPSEVFVDYVARVLPSLGEEAVTLRALGKLVPGISADRYDPPALAAAKGSVRMARLLARAARDEAPDAPDRFRIIYKGELLTLDRKALADLRRTVLQNGARRNAVRAKAAGWVLDALWKQTDGLIPKAIRPPREETAQDIAERPEFRAFMAKWWPVLRPVDVLGWLRDPQRLRRYAEGIYSNNQIDVLTKAFRRFDPENLTVADVALVDELDELLGRPKVKAAPRKDPFHVMDGVHEVSTHADRMAAARRVATERPADYREYAHIVVDESQDVTPMQWRMIGRRGEFASWTVVGDPAQAAWGDAAEATRAMTEAVGTRRKEFALTTNYRNAAEIFEVAAAVIRRAEPGIALPRAVRKAGVDPRHVVTADPRTATVEAVERILGEVDGTVGVIASTARRDEVAGWLPAEERLQVVSGLEAKGMEYDGVIVVEPGAIAAEGRSGVATLYVALSRATQRLTTVGKDLSWLP
ncbi:DNA helicase [Virgisporangium aliadipatigenens]|uniref:DNA helicase n=1 Tax=Virgisporangium aliadipatigenens TaxID=741659 RepID=A0A8J3YNC7_9ACTN|nr:DNA helicase [Virgisporangium aliadipatigenens]